MTTNWDSNDMTNKQNRILIAAGGTGGHFYPAMVLAKELAGRNVKVLFAVKINDSTRARLKTDNFEFREIPCAPFFGQSPVKIIFGLAANFRGVCRAMSVLRDFKPGCVASFGAYVSVPVVLAAFLMRIPVVLHEQNIVPGWANRFSAFFAKKVAVSFLGSEKYFHGKAYIAGNLVRSEIFSADRQKALMTLGLRGDRKTVLVFGGSAGAKSINSCMGNALGGLSSLRDSVQFIHITGSAAESEMLRPQYVESGFHAVVLDYCNEMENCYACSDLAVCRSGATTVSELIVTKTPAILIPFPYAINDHQKKNADILENMGSAVTILESKMAAELVLRLKEIVSSDEMLAGMRRSYDKFPVSLKDAPAKLADTVLSFANEHEES